MRIISAMQLIKKRLSQNWKKSTYTLIYFSVNLSKAPSLGLGNVLKQADNLFIASWTMFVEKFFDSLQIRDPGSR